MGPDPRCSCGHARRTHGTLVVPCSMPDGRDAIRYEDHHGKCRICRDNCPQFDRVWTPLAPAPDPVEQLESVVDLGTELADLRKELAHEKERAETLHKIVCLQLEAATARSKADTHLSEAARIQGKIVDLLLDRIRTGADAPWHPSEGL